MEIAVIVDQFPSVSETFILNQITGLIESGHSVSIFTSRPGTEDETHPDVKKYGLTDHVHCGGMPLNKVKRVLKAIPLIFLNILKEQAIVLNSLNYFKYGPEVMSLRFLYFSLAIAGAEKKEYDIVHCQYGTSGAIGVFLREMGFLKGKLVVSFRGYDLSERTLKGRNKEYAYMLPKIDLFLPVCRYFKNILIDKGCDPRKIIVLKSGTDLSMLKPKKYEEKKKIGLLTVGRLVEKKGVEYALEAISKVKQRLPDVDMHYTIVGEGPLRRRLIKKTRKLGLENNVVFAGKKKYGEVIRIVQDSDILLAPSVTSDEWGYEGIPAAIREAQASCLPVLATRHGGIPEAVKDNESGLLVPEKDIDLLAEKLEYLIKTPEIWRKMGSEGRKIVEKEHDKDKINHSLVEAYKGLLTDA